MNDNKDTILKNTSFAFGIGVVFIVASILGFYSYSNLIIRIFCGIFVFLGFIGIGFEYENIK
ncbi:hypothetical protein [Staphylococcus warneri]|uniref:hypothetical protein n=1 Tax=Staphylococcus warneri TaxID=1292 RepID=UPI001887B7D8|nr:hypothetical protein [Staphylococcus warneri]MBF2265080.1 hypothetical protein [Staphylococcus warneri]MBF2267515.1 hypothetical protein [Staphylococcus warneri]MBF2272145.1 hypothetical protein [Staphylococcus warneri]